MGVPESRQARRFSRENNKKAINSKKGVDNKNIVCYINLTNRKGGNAVMNMKTAGQFAKEALEESPISQKKLAGKMGLKTQQAVFNMLNAKNGMRTDNFVKMMDALGYDVVVRNRVSEEEITLITEGAETE